MDVNIEKALTQDRVIDITTLGKKSGQPRRIEIWFHNIDGQLYITGRPGQRSWYANLVANPAFTFHLKESAQADIPAIATPITDVAAKREILARILQGISINDDLETWVNGSPLVAVHLNS